MTANTFAERFHSEVILRKQMRITVVVGAVVKSLQVKENSESSQVSKFLDQFR